MLTGLISGSRLSSQVGLSIGGYQLVSEQTQKGSTVVSIYRATLTNGGGALASATATATSRSKKLKIVDGTLTFGPVAAGATLVSSDTFSFSRSAKTVVNFADIVWTVVGVPNHPPIANAGPDLTRALGQTAQLDGSASSDQDGNPLTYQWTLTSTPPGSQATLSDSSAVKPTFLVDAPGTYVATLVVSDGVASSAADTVSISTTNSAPVANAGPDQTHAIHTTVTLNGSGSSDVDGDSLTYSWAFVSRPAGSTAVLAGATSVMPSFELDSPGTFVVSLVVHDGFLFSAADTVSITTLNSPPVADAGPDQTAFVTNTVTLDGTGSTDVDGDAITYNWALISAPAGSSAALDDGAVPRPAFVIDRPGIYVAQLVVHDGTVASTADTVTITTENSAPVANAGTAQTIVAGRVAVLDGNASSDVDGDPLTFRWSFTSVPAGSVAVLSGDTGPTPSFVLDQEGMFVVQLIVNDGLTDSTPATVTITTSNSPPAANAGADQINVLAATSVTLDGTQSTDPDEQPLSYRWSLIAKPETSSTGLADDHTATPTLVPDIPGDYVAQLIVNDGFADSAPDTVLVHVVPVPVVTVAAIDPDAAEPYFDPGMIRLTRSDSARPLTVSVTIGGTAENGVDYALLGTTAFFDAGQATVDLPIAPLDDMLVEGPESVTVTLAPGTEYAVGDPASAEVSIADKPSITLSLVDTPVVGVGIPAILRVTLGAPASHGGVTVSVSSGDPARLEVTAPGSVSIADGDTAGDIFLSGLAPATVTLHAEAAHYQNATLDADVVRNIISIPSTFNAPLGPSNLAITIERDASNPGPVSIHLVSDDASIISVSTPTVIIPAGELSASATIVGAGLGSTTLRATATNFVSDSGVGTVAAALDITAAALTINSAAGNSITIELESPPGTPSAAPAGGILVNLSAADPACVSVPATVTIASGAITAAATVAHGGKPALPCTTTVTATGPTGVASDSISVTVNQAPSINAPASLGAMGGGLQIGPFTATLSAAQFSVVRVRLTSNDPARVLLSPNATTPGAAAIDIDVPQGQTAATFHVQGTDWTASSSPDNVTITFSALGFNGDTTSVSYVQPAIALFDLPTAPTAGSLNTDFTVRVGIPGAGNATVSDEQVRRAGASALTVTVTNSQATVAEIDPNGGGTGAQLQTASIEAGKSSTPNNLSGGLEFDPKAAGTTVVSATSPGFITTTAATKTVTVAASPALSLPAVLPPLAAGLQDGAYTGTLAAAQSTAVIVHLESMDPSRVLLATSTTAAGQAALDITVPSGQTSFNFHVQGTDWIPGSTAGNVTITASAEAFGFTEDSTTINYVQAAVGFVSLPATTTSLSASTAFQARVGVPRADNTDIQTAQERRPATAAEQAAGIVPNLTVTVSSGTPSVAKLEKILDAQGNISVEASHDTLIAVGAQATPLQTVGGLRFDPIDAGASVVTATIPGFITTAAAAKTVTVTATAGISFPANFGQVGAGLQNGTFSGTLGASQHGGVTVRLTSGDPTRVLLAPNTTTPGSAEITFDLANGQTGFTYVIQATDWIVGTSSAATVTITAQATGFSNATGTVGYVQPALDLNLPATTTDLSSNTDFAVRVGIGTTLVTQAQNRRAGAPPLIVTVTNSDETVAELDDDGGLNGLQEKTRSILAGQQNTPSGAGGLEFDPLSTGTTVVTATIPGFITTPAGAKTVTVGTPVINISAGLGSIGGGLQFGPFNGSLSATEHGGVTVRLVSSDPSRVLLSPNATTPGADAIDLSVADGQIGFSFFVQGTDWIPGMSTAQSVTVTITAPGFTSRTTSINYVQPALDLQSVPTTIGATGANVDFTVRVGVPAAFNTAVTTLQARRAGAPALVVTVGTSDTAVAEIDFNGGVNDLQPLTTSIVPGQVATPFNTAGGLEFDPKAVGTTVVTATIPGFITTAAGAKTVTINP